MNKVMLLLLFLLTSSCNISLTYKPETIKELLPVGSTLRLTQVLEIPANRSMIYIAHGKVAPLKNINTVDIYQPYCMFYLDKESSQVRQVVPDTFDVTKVVEWEDYHGSNGQIKLASLDLAQNGVYGIFSDHRDDGGPDIIMYATILSIRSDKQPEVKELVCGHWDDQGIVEPLTLKEMKSALGDLIVIERTTKQAKSN